MQITRIVTIAPLALALGAGPLATGCGPGRTAAATQTTPAAFDAAKSDAKAVEIADRVIAAVGGDAAWDKARQFEFDTLVTIDGQPKLAAHHAWDRWNGRHRFEKTNPTDGSKLAVAYEIFGGAAWASRNGKTDIPRDTVNTLKTEAQRRLAVDTFNLVFPFKLKDPGVTLKYVEERPLDGGPADQLVYDVIKMTFDPGVGPTPGDVYYVVVQKADNMIHHVEVVEEGKADDQRIAYEFQDWQTVGGLKLSMKRQNIGYKAEVIQFQNLKVTDSPDDQLYVQQVR